MKNTECPICHNHQTDIHPIIFDITRDKKYTIHKCSNCKSIYTFFDEEINIRDYYEDKDYAIRDTANTVFYYIQQFEYTRIIKKIKKYISVLSPALLDFGSGKGLFLHFAKQLGFSVKGVETSLPRANYAKVKLQLIINNDYYLQGRVFDEEFDVITCFHVLEHLNNPVLLLQNLVSDNLKEGGLLLVEVPNFNSWQSKWAGKYWLHLDVPRHLSHFTPHQLRKIFQNTGCHVIKEEFFSFHLGIIGMIQTIFSFFSYRNSLIVDLKEKKTWWLIIRILLVFPFALLLEAIASFNKSGGIIRYYAVKNRKSI